MTQPIHAVCTRCHQHKPLSELNGYNPIIGSTANLYCKRLADCQSNQAAATLSKLTTAIVGCAQRTNPIAQSKQEA